MTLKELLKLNRSRRMGVLDLSTRELAALPSEIGKLTNLTQLDVRGNKLTALPPQIGNLTNLTGLNLASNQLTGLPTEIGQLTNLTHLTLHNNQLTALPAEIGKLTKLTRLHLHENKLTALPPQIGKLTNLTHLLLDDNPLTSPPPEIISQGTEVILAYLRGQSGKDRGGAAPVPAAVQGLIAPKMNQIQLEGGTWFYDPKARLGRKGGFGEVFEGKGEDGEAVAVKRLYANMSKEAHREQDIAPYLGNPEWRHVIPVLDYGFEASVGTCFLVMPRAEKSLEDELEAGKRWEDSDAAQILLQIAAGLQEAEELVHRDLKPGNVLYHEGTWKIADFGIARFVEETTSARTLKGYLSNAYAAPEQWNFQRATQATDIYALGCIGYALLTGNPPFPGPGREEYCKQHLTNPPPELPPHHDPVLQSILLAMLTKVPESRPAMGRVASVLNRVAAGTPANSLGSGVQALGELGARLATEQAEADARAQDVRIKDERRKTIAGEAFKILADSIWNLCKTVVECTQSADYIGKGASYIVGEEQVKFPNGVTLGRAKLVINAHNPNRPISETGFSACNWDVVLGSAIVVEQAEPYYEWGTSLWYSRLDPKGEYRWREVGYMWRKRPSKFAPFALEDIKRAAQAAAPPIAETKIVWGPEPIDQDSTPALIDRWARVLAKAAEGKIVRPRKFPLRASDW